MLNEVINARAEPWWGPVAICRKHKNSRLFCSKVPFDTTEERCIKCLLLNFWFNVIQDH